MADARVFYCSADSAVDGGGSVCALRTTKLACWLQKEKWNKISMRSRATSMSRRIQLKTE